MYPLTVRDLSQSRYRRFTILLTRHYPRKSIWLFLYTKPELNRQHSAYQADTLPLSYSHVSLVSTGESFQKLSKIKWLSKRI